MVVSHLFMQTTEECAHEVEERFHSSVYSNFSLVHNPEWPHGYDATWALALMLNRSNEVLMEKYPDGSKRLEDFTYSDKEMSEIFIKELHEEEFVGLTVCIGLC